MLFRLISVAVVSDAAMQCTSYLNSVSYIIFIVSSIISICHQYTMFISVVHFSKIIFDLNQVVLQVAIIFKALLIQSAVGISPT